MPTGMTLLQLVQSVCNEVSIVAPTAVVTNTQQDIIQIYALMNACGVELLRKHPWQALYKRHSFFTEFVTTTGTYNTTTRQITGIPSTAGLSTSYMIVGNGFPNATFIESVDSPTQVTATTFSTQNIVGGTVYFQKAKYDFPSDYSSIVARTQYDANKHWEMLGPESPQQWEWLLSGYIATGPRIRWRIFQDYFQIWPGMSTPENLTFEYRSNGWVMSAAGVPKKAFTADDDTSIFRDRLLINFCKLKYFESKGFDTTAMLRNFLTELETDMGLDQSFATLSFAPRPGSVLIGWDNIPDSGYGR